MGDNRKDAIPPVEYIVQRWFKWHDKNVKDSWGDIGDGPCDFDKAVGVVCEAIDKDATVLYQEDFRVVKINWGWVDPANGTSPVVDATEQVFRAATERLRGLEE